MPQISTKSSDEANTTGKEGEYHVASFLAHAIMESVDVVKAAISSIDGGEVHGVGPTGKIIFTLEADSQQAIGRHIDELKYHQGLLSLAPVFHQFLPANQD